MRCLRSMTASRSFQVHEWPLGPGAPQGTSCLAVAQPQVVAQGHHILYKPIITLSVGCGSTLAALLQVVGPFAPSRHPEHKMATAKALFVPGSISFLYSDESKYSLRLLSCRTGLACHVSVDSSSARACAAQPSIRFPLLYKLSLQLVKRQIRLSCCPGRPATARRRVSAGDMRRRAASWTASDTRARALEYLN